MKGAKKAAMLMAAQVSLGGNLFLFALKAAALVCVNSLAIATDLGITVVGLTVSVILYYSVKLANRPADFMHNYGYGKIEHVCEALEGVVLIGIALAMSFQALAHLLHHPKEIGSPWLGFGFSVISAAVNFFGSFWILALGKRCASPAVKAEGLHYQLEGYISSTIAVAFLIAVLLGKTALKPWAVYLDPLATLAVSILISVPSYRLAKDAFFKLLDASFEERGKMEVIKQLGKYMGRCCEFKEIRTRSAGRKHFVELKLILPRALPFRDAHRLASEVERDLCLSIPECTATVSIVPCNEDCAFMTSSKPCPYLS